MVISDVVVATILSFVSGIRTQGFVNAVFHSTTPDFTPPHPEVSRVDGHEALWKWASPIA